MPHLKSNIGRFHGELCASNVVLTCNALEFGNSGTIGWYTDDYVISMEMLDPNDIYPKILQVNSSLSGLVVKIENVFTTGTKFNFINFSLSGNLSAMLQFQQCNIICGTKVDKSNIIRIGDFTIKGTTDNLELCLIFINELLHITSNVLM